MNFSLSGYLSRNSTKDRRTLREDLHGRSIERNLPGLAWKWGGGCISTILIFVIVFWLLLRALLALAIKQLRVS